MTHYFRGRSRLCGGDECDAALHKSDRVWKGYAAVELYIQERKKWSPVVLEITENLELDFRGMYTRGQVWELWADPKVKNKNSPVYGKFMEQREESTFPAAFDYVPCLRAMYHVDRIDLSILNPCPPRVIVSDSDGEAPEVLKPIVRETAEYDSPEMMKLREKMNKAYKSPTEKRREVG